MAVLMLDDGIEMPQDFAECSSVSYFIPLGLDLDLEAACDPSNADPFASIECRESLFFGKLLPKAACLN